MTSCLKRYLTNDASPDFTLDRCFRVVLSTLYGRNGPTLFWLILAFTSLLSLTVGLLGGSLMYDEQIDITERQADRIDELEQSLNAILQYIDYGILTTSNKTEACGLRQMFDKGIFVINK